MNVIDVVKPIWEKCSKYDNRIYTYCNLFVTEVMITQDYFAFRGYTANTIVETMEYEKFHWRKINPIDPADWAQDTIVVAGQKGEPHGHVCILLPGEFVISPKWENIKVPQCANIGKENFWMKGVNWAFGKNPPHYYQFSK